mmetsp:Transcript_29565/g.71149  ORF Transcript_29565/g.71149 Transcript_29565/m.71149 type:complete len:431 (+) Transcript_29565:1232-2524(+)
MVLQRSKSPHFFKCLKALHHIISRSNEMVFPCIEPSTGGELCFVSSTHGDLRIQCNTVGKLSMDRNWKGWDKGIGWEVWRFVRSDRGDGSLFISSWTHSQFNLSSDPGGHVTSSKNQESWELWKVEKAGNGSENSVLIRSLEHDRLLQCRDGLLSTTESSGFSDKCLWNLETANLGNFFLHCNEKNKQIGCPQSVDETPFLTENRKEWEVWSLRKVEEGNCFTICSDAHGWYLRSDDKNRNVCLSAESGSERWHLANHEGFTVLVSSSGGYLACGSEGHFFIASEPGVVCTSWALEPRMPGTISGHQIRALAGVGMTTLGLGFVTLGLGVAMPFAIVGGVTGMGFTASGIAAVSTAAGMMPAQTVVLGGAVAAHGAVVTLQSQRAVALGMPRTAAAVFGGAVVGAGVSPTALGTSGILNTSEAGVAASEH